MNQKTKGLTFGEALILAKGGRAVAREGWNGKGMWIAMSPGSPQVPSMQFWSKANREYAESRDSRTASVLPCMTMRTADGSILMGWLASQTDMLAVDWMEVAPV